MSFLPLVRYLGQSPLTLEFLGKLKHQILDLKGLSRLPKGLLTSALARQAQRNLLVVTATLEEAGRWTAQLEAMGWDVVHFYPTSEASPYEPFDLEAEMVWGQFQVLADLQRGQMGMAVVATEGSLQPHLPPPDVFRSFGLLLRPGLQMSLKELGQALTRLGYERVSLVESEGQWSQRGDLVDVFPVASEWPVRLEWFGSDLEKLREFDPVSQRSQDALSELLLTATNYGVMIAAALQAAMDQGGLPSEMSTADWQTNTEGLRQYLGLAYASPASLADYLPESTLVVIDEPEQCCAHSQQWVNQAQELWQALPFRLPPLHRPFAVNLDRLAHFPQVRVSELASGSEGLDCKTRAVAAIPHQFAALAKTIREQRQQGSQVWVVSAQPSRAVALLQEHDCPAQFVPNPKDFPTLDRLVDSQTPTALKYVGLAELAGFVWPLYRTVLVTDREFFGQHSLATSSYIRKRRQASSRQVDPNLLQPGDFVVHKAHGIGKFLRLETLTLNGETREYLVIQYSDGELRVAADQVNSLSRYRSTSERPPVLNKMSGQAWEKTKNKVKKAIQKVAYDLLELYAKRAEQRGFAFPADSPWQQEMEDSFPYQPTPDQLKSIQDVKGDMESERPMDRLVCGDVGFGKTEIAIRAIFKAVTSGKQVALLAPTTILTQQHYHTLKERFAPYPIQVGLLNRFRSSEEKKDILARLATGEMDIVVGTHQILGKEVRFKDLGLLVIDEEQRFGVNQKEKIKALKTQVDVLTLTATPIPRTLYMSLSGLREMSLISTPPPSRRPIKTHLSPYKPEAVHTAIRQELDRGGQVFYVVNRVEGIEEVAGKLREMIPQARISIAHGQMPEGELEATMLTFNNGETDILVCTTIIESGLDIPRVNTILVENAEFFGLSQLYQLRGRVGRAGIQAHAWLFYRDQATLTEDARKRLRAIQEFTQLGSGYQLAIRDMEIRGVGNLLGTEQSGQVNTVGFDLYMEMLQDAIKEIRGQEIPVVDDTQIDLNITAMIPQHYIPDPDQKMQAYRQVAVASSRVELAQIAAAWLDRYGSLPKPTQELLRVMELKQLAKSLGFSRIKPLKEHVILETPMAEPAWQRLKETLPSHLQARFIYQPSKVTVRGLGQVPAHQQLENLITWFEKMNAAVGQTSLSGIPG
ncbi:MAG: transcription-repair coupling factor [Cyanobacteriota bacterium]|nr:transcription-repair coupling factor [Cyanobacteriota bacterium]